MKTDDLVLMLATGAGGVPRQAAARRYALALSLGMTAAGILMLGLLGLRPDLGQVLHLPMFWVKLGYPAALASASLLAVRRLSRPGAALAVLPAALAAPVLAMWALAAVVLIGAAPEQRLALLLGSTWATCPLLIALLSVPVFAATMLAMRTLAPTALSLAGASVGLLSGSVGAMVYCLHCPELDAPFIGTWYLLGMLIPAVVGAWLGPRILSW